MSVANYLGVADLILEQKYNPIDFLSSFPSLLSSIVFRTKWGLSKHIPLEIPEDTMEQDSMELTSCIQWHHMCSMSCKGYHIPLCCWKDSTPLTTASPVSSGLAKKPGILDSSNSPCVLMIIAT